MSEGLVIRLGRGRWSLVSGIHFIDQTLEHRVGMLALDLPGWGCVPFLRVKLLRHDAKIFDLLGSGEKTVRPFDFTGQKRGDAWVLNQRGEAGIWHVMRARPVGKRVEVHL